MLERIQNGSTLRITAGLIVRLLHGVTSANPDQLSDFTFADPGATILVLKF